MDRIDFLWICVGAWVVWGVYWVVAAFSANRTRSSEGIFPRLGHIRPLAVGFVLIFHGGRRGWIVGHIHHNKIIEVIATAVTIFGLLFSLWSRVHLGKYWSGIITLKEGHKLIRTGPYRIVRHPLYTGFLIGVLDRKSTRLNSSHRT